MPNLTMKERLQREFKIAREKKKAKEERFKRQEALKALLKEAKELDR